jgi:LPS-assembly lipoprotein
MRTHSILFVMCGCLLNSACGFHLRGSNYEPNLQINRVFLSSRGAGAIEAELRRQFGYNDIQLAAKSAEAQAVITVANERTDERVLSVDPRTGKAREYELGYHVSFKIDDADGKPVTALQTIDLSRDFTFDEAAALSKFEEAKVVREEMKRDAVDSILRRLESIRPRGK